MKNRANAGRGTDGFTLIELVVVITIIAILATLALLVGQRVTQSARINLTRDLLRTLDKTQDNYTADKGGDGTIPYKWTNDRSTTPLKDEFAVADAKIFPAGNLDRVEPSLTFYLLATKEAPSVQATFGQLDSRFVISSPLSNGAPANSTFNDYSTIYTRSLNNPQSGAPANQPMRGLVVKDPWGNAIRYVHPKFQGGYGDFDVVNSGAWSQGSAPGRPTSLTVSLNQSGSAAQVMFERSYHPPTQGTGIGDADEGLCVGGRGYFYSCGPDGDPGTREDNVYTTPPQFPKETAKSSAAQ